MAAMHQMRDAFCAVKQAAEDAGGGFGALAAENGSFFDGYAEAKRLFARMVRDLDSQGR